MNTIERVNWPYDAEAAKTIECYLVKAPCAKLYVWRDLENGYSTTWNYTFSAGPNSERSHSGCLSPADTNLSVEHAVTKAINQIQRDKVWYS
jgi:hypothetical protein